MRQKVKHIGALFMWTALLVILCHSIIPHHHHSEETTCEQECSHGKSIEIASQLPTIHFKLVALQCQSTHEHENCQACHFTTEATTALSKLILDHSFNIYGALICILLPTNEVIYFDTWVNHYSFDFYTHTSSRGPPAIG